MVRVLVKRNINAALGRFGFVKVGDVLSLTDHEWNCVSADCRFGRIDNLKAAKIEADNVAKADAAEKARLSSLVTHNSPANVLRQEVDQMNREQLKARAEQLRASGKPIEFGKHSENRSLRRAIVAAELNQQAEPPALVEEEQTA